ncbi:polyprenyl synthetase family protein [Streptomyces sp. NPDC005953]|uniref:polyprenyl synthetase family protein n=1 Tax=Streptomyces sp. NPDC005953 TaxID=3156719 RepID=UPI0033E6E502
MIDTRTTEPMRTPQPKPAQPQPTAPAAHHGTDGRPRQQPTAAPSTHQEVVTHQELVTAVERVLERHLHERVSEAARIDPVFADQMAARLAEFVLRGGKRLRAGFLWWGWQAAGGDLEQADAALHLGAALELLQGCALIHDDVMDASPVRRGAPAVHTDFTAAHARARMHGSSTAYGTAAAVLCGDLALSWADDLVSVTALSCTHGRRLHQEWRALRTELIAGQYLDIHGQANRSTGLAQAVRIAGLKSALYTVERPLALGAALAGADEATTAALRSAGRCAGIAFQLRDDLLGVYGEPAVTGKPSGEDLRDAKPTYLRAVAVQRARAAGDHHAVRALTRASTSASRDSASRDSAPFGEQDLDDQELDALREVIERTGARTAVEEQIERLVELSVRHLHTVRRAPHTTPAPPSPQTAHVIDALTRLIERAAAAPAGPPRAPDRHTNPPRPTADTHPNDPAAAEGIGRGRTSAVPPAPTTGGRP